MIMGDISPPGREHGFSLSQDSFLFHQPRRELSRTTPVLDSIEGLGAFAQDAIDHVRRGYSVDLFVIGRAGDGKSAISEQIIQRDRISEKKPIRRAYFNTSMAVEEARLRGVMTSPFGQFTPNEYERLSQEVIKGKLEQTEGSSDRNPQLRILEFTAVETKINVGNSAIEYSSERIARDSSYRRRIIGVIGERGLHRRNRRMREEILEANTPEVLQRIFRKYGITPDKPNIDPFDMRERMGPPSSMDRIDADLTEQLLQRQGDIRIYGIDRGLPMLDQKSLAKDGALEVRALSGLYLLQALQKGFKEEEIFIAVNRLLRRKIPYYGRMRNDPSLRL